MGYAIIKTGGKQYRVAVGDEIFVETIAGEPDDEVTFDEVLAISDGESLQRVRRFLKVRPLRVKS